MKSFAFCFKRNVAELLITKKVGDSFSIMDLTFLPKPTNGIVLHRHVTPCGVLLLVETEHDRGREHRDGDANYYRAYWLSDCGSSGQLITGNHTTTRGQWLQQDPDYTAAVKDYDYLWQTATDFVSENFTALGSFLST